MEVDQLVFYNKNLYKIIVFMLKEGCAADFHNVQYNIFLNIYRAINLAISVCLSVRLSVKVSSIKKARDNRF